MQSTRTRCLVVAALAGGLAITAALAASAPRPTAPAQGGAAQAPAPTAPAGSPSAAKRPKGVFLPEGVDWKSVIGPPPAPESCQAAADLAVVRFEQLRRTPAEVDGAWRGVAL